MAAAASLGPLGLFGGTFDPVHWGHLLLAEGARDHLGLAQVHFVPARIPPHKQHSTVTATAHRVAMLELAIEDNPGFALCRWELEQEGPSYTVDTLRHMRALGWGPIYLLIGGDSLAQLPTWRESETVRQLATLVVVDRPGWQPDIEGVMALPLPQLDISSTAIRDRIRQGRSVRYWLPESVRGYIATHRIYGA